jgi:hypothetical protein
MNCVKVVSSGIGSTREWAFWHVMVLHFVSLNGRTRECCRLTFGQARRNLGLLSGLRGERRDRKITKTLKFKSFLRPAACFCVDFGLEITSFVGLSVIVRCFRCLRTFRFNSVFRIIACFRSSCISLYCKFR